MEPGQIGAMIPIVAVICGAVVMIFGPMARSYARQMDKSPRNPIPPEIAGRLERIEQAVDAIAIEVERISEGQRFTTQLLSDTRQQQSALRSGRAAPHTTPV